MKKNSKKTNDKTELVYEPIDPVTRWNACQILMSRIYKSDISTAELLRCADEPVAKKALGFVTRRI